MGFKTKIFIIFIFVNLCTTVLNAQEKLDQQLKVLSWNIFCLPTFIKATDKMYRASAIVDALQHLDCDVIVLQETFHKKSHQIIEEGLKDTFPYQIKANRKGNFIKTNHGIFILSKLPAKLLGTIVYKNCKGTDCLAKKGAVLIEVEKEKQMFQILGTHLQAGNQNKYEAIRKTQREQITAFLKQYKKENIPQLLCGDFNTDYNNLSRRNNLLNDLEINHINVPNDTTWPNKYYKTKKTHTTIVDYIFIKYNNVSLNTETKILHFYDQKRKIALSDHSAVEMLLAW